jgi:hypothetical protein
MAEAAQSAARKRVEDYGKVVTRAWRDPAFKAKLKADPEAALKEAGVALPAGLKVTVVENTAQHFHLVLPPKPSAELSDELLDKVAGGGFAENWDMFWADGF